MAQRGKASTAHQYDERGVCIYCDMYKKNVERMVHVCKPWREFDVDAKACGSDDPEVVNRYRRGELDGERSVG